MTSDTKTTGTQLDRRIERIAGRALQGVRTSGDLAELEKLQSIRRGSLFVSKGSKAKLPLKYRLRDKTPA